MGYSRKQMIKYKYNVERSISRIVRQEIAKPVKLYQVLNGAFGLSV